MGKLVLGLILLAIGVLTRFTAASFGGNAPGRPAGLAGSARALSLVFVGIGAALIVASAVVVIAPGTVGVQHAFGKVYPDPLLAGIRIVTPWSSIERYSTREEQFPEIDQPEELNALSSEQMGMKVDIALRWQIDPQRAPHIFTEIGNERQIHSAVRNAIQNGVRDGMVQFSINDLGKRNQIANVMEAEVDSALVTQPRDGGPPFRIASVTAFFLRDLQPPAQVIAAINSKIAQEQQIATERHRVEVARLQAEQQRLLNLTLTPEALTKQYLEVLQEMRTSNNLVLLVPTEGGIPILDIGQMRGNLRANPR